MGTATGTCRPRLHFFNKSDFGQYLFENKTEKKSLEEEEINCSNLGSVKLGTVLPTTCQCGKISLKRVVLLGHNDAEMGPTNLLQASA